MQITEYMYYLSVLTLYCVRHRIEHTYYVSYDLPNTFCDMLSTVWSVMAMHDIIYASEWYCMVLYNLALLYTRVYHHQVIL